MHNTLKNITIGKDNLNLLIFTQIKSYNKTLHTSHDNPHRK